MPLTIGCDKFGSGGIVLTAARKTQFAFVVLGLWAVFLLLTSGSAHAQTHTRVKITVSAPNEIHVEADLSVPSRSWSFRNAYAGALGIAERIDGFRANGALARKLTVGEFRTEQNAGKIDYIVRVRHPSAAHVAHLTWLTEEHGILMFADLLPQAIEAISVEFILPSGWTIHSSLAPEANGRYSVFEPDDAVFFAGRGIRKTSKKGLDTFIGGTWPFKDSIASNAAVRVMEKYLELTRFRLPEQPVVMIAPLPVQTGSTKWRAQTRGSTVVLLLDPQAQSGNWKGQLEIIFTHEILHLWVPNALQLRGDYDWFFEGFTLYTALLTALDLKAIDFREYLATLRRVYDSYLSYEDTGSLIDASEKRWTSNTPIVYDKGMLVAFLYDLLIREESGGKSTLLDRYRELFQHPAADRAEGNEVIIRVLSSTPAAAEFVKKHVHGRAPLELETVLKELQTDKRRLKSLGYR
jgi:hypothetical protein